AGVLVLVQRPAAVVHRFAGIDHQRRLEVGLGFVLLHVVAIGLGPDLPVEVANIVARRVLAVLGELDALPEERAPVHAGKEAFDDLTGPQIEPADAGNGLGMQKATGIIGHEWVLLRTLGLDHDAKIFWNLASFVSSPSRAGVSLSRRSTTTSGVIPSEAA